MARFRALVNGDRSTASRLGRERIEAQVNGWDRGIEVRAYVDKDTGLDTFEVYRTAGSNGSCQRELIGRYI